MCGADEMNQIGYCIDLLRQLVAIPSSSQNEEEIACFLEDFLRGELGMEAGIQHAGGKSYNVRGQMIREGAARRLMLGGHIDTVPPTDRWDADPYRLEVRGDHIRGLGAGDMKGGLAAQLTVLAMLRAGGIELDCDVEFLGLADEERHSVGANAYVEEREKEGASAQDVFFIMAEPHYDNIVVGATGKVLYRIDVYGEGGHASTPEQGVNAVDCMAEFLTHVNRTFTPEYRQGRRASHCCLYVESCGQGYSLNIPEHCFCLLNKQLNPEEDAGLFAEELKRLYRDKVRRGSIAVTRQIPSYPSYRLPPGQKDVSALVGFLSREFHHTPELRVNQSVSDGNILYHCLGIPTVLYGPQGVDFHTEREHLLKSSLISYIEQLYQYLIARYSRGAE